MFHSKLKHILACHPIVKTDIVKASDAYLFDSEGKKYVDFEAGIWCVALGHSNSRVNTVIKEQIEKVMNTHFKLSSDVAESLAVNLLKILKFEDGKAVFLSSGSEAVEFGIRIGKLASKGTKLLTFSTSYLSAYSNTSFPRDKNTWIQVDFLQCRGCTKRECMSTCEVISDIDFSDISSFVLEPGSSSGRVLFPPNSLVRFLSENVKRNGGSVIVNEVTTGFGRTGKWFGYNHYDIDPDIVVLGKALGNGYPISAIVMRQKIANKVEQSGFGYAQSHQNDPLGCVIANEVIRVFNEENIIEKTKEISGLFLRELYDIKHSCSLVKDVRGRGLMLALELHKSKVTEIIFEKMLSEGYFIGTTPVSNVIRFFPPLTISANDILRMTKELKYQLKELEKTLL